MPELVVQLPDGTTARHALTLKPQDVGRDPGCHIQIDDATVSRRHADIRGDANGRFMIRDLGSKNGTLVNQDPVTTRQLDDGDEIIFGSIPARFQTGNASFNSTLITVDEGATQVAPSISYVGAQEQLKLSQQRLQMLYEISDRLTGLRGRQELLKDIIKICVDTFHFERAAIGVMQENRRGMDWPVVHNMRGADGEIKMSRTILKRALEEGQRVIFSDTQQEILDPSVSIVQQGTRSAMCVPIAYSDEILGVIYGDRTTTARRYEQEDVDFLAALARQVSIGLTNARLMEEHEQKVYLEKEIAIARQIQSDLFPETLEIHPAVTVAALNEPGRQVSGDYYDVIHMSGNRVGLVIADVTGKGVASALIAANLQAAVRLLMPDCEDLVELATRFNDLVFQNTHSSRFITAVLAVLDPAARKLEFVSAGHYPPILKSVSRTLEITADDTNLPFGIDEDTKYSCLSYDLGAEPSALLFYTDGLNEALDENEEEFGTERILETLQEATDTNPHQLIHILRERVNAFSGNEPQRDDITIISTHMT